MAKQAQDIAQQVTNEVIQAIENGTECGKWIRPWAVTASMPVNAVTGKAYNGTNALMLLIRHGGGEFAGYGQWQTIGAQVTKGSKAIGIYLPMIRASKELQANGKPKMIPIGFKAGNVFAAHQVEGYEAPVAAVNDNFCVHAQADTQIAYMVSQGCTVNHGGDQAMFVPSTDNVHMPNQSQFPIESDYYATMLHELVHWTGGKARLNRGEAQRTKYESNAYAFEELVAELGATFLCGELGVELGDRNDHIKYISGWLSIMKGDKNAIMAAASQASKAVDVIMGRRHLDGSSVKAESEALAA
jgi:antirestriction protein ArdC